MGLHAIINYFGPWPHPIHSPIVLRATPSLRRGSGTLQCIVLCRLVVRVHCQPHCTKQYSVVQCRVFSPQSMHFPIVWCAVYIHFAACSLTTNLQSTILADSGCRVYTRSHSTQTTYTFGGKHPTKVVGSGTNRCIVKYHPLLREGVARETTFPTTLLNYPESGGVGIFLLRGILNLQLSTSEVLLLKPGVIAHPPRPLATQFFHTLYLLKP